MIEFEVRHGITNREADIGTDKLGSGSRGRMSSAIPEA